MQGVNDYPKKTSAFNDGNIVNLASENMWVRDFPTKNIKDFPPENNFLNPLVFCF